MGRPTTKRSTCGIFSAWCAGTGVLREAIRPDVGPRLDVLPSGATPPNPSELLGSEAMKKVVAEVRREYDYIVIDTPPTLPVTDAAVVSTTADATIIVLRSGDTEEAAAQRAVAQLARVNARLAGAVLVGVSQSREHYHTYYAYRRDRPARRPARSWGWRLADKL